MHGAQGTLGVPLVDEDGDVVLRAALGDGPAGQVSKGDDRWLDSQLFVSGLHPKAMSGQGNFTSPS